jgi:hypothetical protein
MRRCGPGSPRRARCCTSPDEKARSVVEELREEAARDLAALERAVSLAEAERQALCDAGPSAGQLALFALSVDRAYSACEALLLRIARALDRVVPAGASWHAALLHQMTLPIQDVRPAVIEPETARLAGEWLRFRHFLRHAYRTDLEWGRLGPVVDTLGPGAERFRADVETLLRSL